MEIVLTANLQPRVTNFAAATVKQGKRTIGKVSKEDIRV